MGMYTEIVVGIRFNKKTTNDVLDIIDHMLDSEKPRPKQLPDHPLFKTNRWPYMLQCSSYYFPVVESTHLFNRKESFLSVRASLKNYDNEIDLFFDWIKEYVATSSGKTFMGYSLYEEVDDPTLYYRDEND